MFWGDFLFVCLFPLIKSKYLSFFFFLFFFFFLWKFWNELFIQSLRTVFFCFLSFLICGPPEQQNPLDIKFVGGGVYLFVSFLFGFGLFVCFFFLLINTRSGILTGIRWSVCISKSQRRFCVLFSKTNSGLCIYHFLVRSNFNLLHNSQWMTFHILLCLVLYWFYARLLHSLIMGLTISSLSLNNLHLLFFRIISIFTFI